jgi:hypothetical protein
MAWNADFLYEVTIFQPIRPLVRWSNVDQRLAIRNGASNEVEAVMPNARFWVTAAIAEIGYNPSAAVFCLGLINTYNCRISHWPLSCSPHAVVQLPRC